MAGLPQGGRQGVLEEGRPSRQGLQVEGSFTGWVLEGLQVYQLPGLPLLAVVAVLVLRLLAEGVDEQDLALDGQHEGASHDGLDQVCQPGPGLVCSLPLQDVQQEV